MDHCNSLVNGFGNPHGKAHIAVQPDVGIDYQANKEVNHEDDIVDVVGRSLFASFEHAEGVFALGLGFGHIHDDGNGTVRIRFEFRGRFV